MMFLFFVFSSVSNMLYVSCHNHVSNANVQCDSYHSTCPQVTQQKQTTQQWAAPLPQSLPTWQRCPKALNCWQRSWRMKVEVGSSCWVLPRTWPSLSLRCWRPLSLQTQRYPAKLRGTFVLKCHVCVLSSLWTYYILVLATSEPAPGCRKCGPGQRRAAVTHRRDWHWSTVPGVFTITLNSAMFHSCIVALRKFCS